jgi:diacylglycerol kinase (ATP)
LGRRCCGYLSRKNATEMVSAPAGFRDKACLGILSPGASQRIWQYRDGLSPHFVRLSLIYPESLERLKELVANSAGEYEVILAVGGDGTVNQVVQRLDLDTQTLMVLPSGTGNDLSRALHMPREFEEYARALPSFRVMEIDAWKIGERRFVNSLGIGLDTQVLETMANSRGLLHSNYMAAFLATLPRLRRTKIHARLDGSEAVVGNVWWLVAMNSVNIGGGLPVAPGADLSDGKLDVVVIGDCPRVEMLLKLPKLYRQTHLGDKRISHMHAAQIDLGDLTPPVAIGIDGELTHFADTSLHISHAGKIKVAYAAEDKP